MFMEQNLLRVPTFSFCPEKLLAIAQVKQKDESTLEIINVPKAIKSKYFSNNIETIHLRLTNTSRSCLA